LDTILQQLAGPGVPATQGPCITKQQFAAWRKQYTLDALQGTRYGVSFCQYFKILDYRIYFDSTPERCDEIIQKEWIVTA
jgi:hypothetical protein